MTNLLFISPRYLLPADMGGKIRTAHVLKGLKGGRFHVTLMSPSPDEIPQAEQAQLAEMCDLFVPWPEPRRSALHRYTRVRHLLGDLPIPVATDRSPAARDAIAAALPGADVVVVDFLHAAVLMPAKLEKPCVLFTHNVEAEIFERHLALAKGALHRYVWQDQTRKMKAFEAQTLRSYDGIVAVSERDRAYFKKAYGVEASTIPTGVDLDYFAFHPPKDGKPVIAFTASMDSLANIDGVRWLMDEVWPLIVKEVPDAEMRVIGRNPDPGLVAEAKRRGLAFTFTGYVDDVRPHLDGAQVYVIPLRVGGGTRIKAFEAMAFGLPTVSTAIGIEGLGVAPEAHYLEADTAPEFAAAVLRLLRDGALRRTIALSARRLVEDHYSARRVGEVFESICVAAMEKQGSNVSPARIPARGMSAA